MIPGSALRRLVAITGLGAGHDVDGGFWYLAVIDPPKENIFLKSFLKNEKAACQQLRDQNWARVTRIVFERQEWKCAKCHGVKALQGHHVRFRSRWRRCDGPLDHEDNILGECGECHGEEHRG